MYSNKDNVRTTLDCGAFAYPLLPWKSNNTFPFIVAGVYVAVNNVSVHCAKAVKNGFPLQWYRATDYFVLLLKRYIVNQYNMIQYLVIMNIINIIISVRILALVIQHSQRIFSARIILSTVSCLTLQYLSTLIHDMIFWNNLLNTTSTLWCSPQLLWNISHSKKSSVRYYHKCT